ncbi:Sodium:dicarboxylate symporter-like protein 2 [Sarcoptes scabiei]|nr:Sodium:dicarboxylate symporter-like protein 2 [Sarcoptes scabiei]
MDFGRRSVELDDNKTATDSLEKAIKRSRYGKILYFINKNLLAISTLILIALSVLITILLRRTIKKPWSSRKLMNLKFVGEIFIRIILSLIAPLIGTSIAYACTGFDPNYSGRILIEIICYYLITTIIATLEGLLLVTMIGPGLKSSKIIKITTPSLNSSKHPILIEDTVLDMIRNVFTDNLFQSWFSIYHTRLVPPINLNETSDDFESWQISGTQENGTNVMSVVLLGLLVGLSVNLIRTRGGRLMVDLIEASNTLIMMVTLVVVQIAPVATVFLIIPQTLSIGDLGEMFSLIGWFTMTVLLALTIHCLITLSLMYLVVTRKNPYKFIGNLIPALSTAFATSSSSATMSVTMQCLENNLSIPISIVRFVIPFGSTVNMDGSALYESVAAIFVAQYHRRNLNFGQLITISLTSILVSIGAAGIPQAGMITTVVVLNSIGFSLEDAALVIVVDFMLDRFRTMVNVLGDAFGAAVVHSRLNRILGESNRNQTKILESFSATDSNSKNSESTLEEAFSLDKFNESQLKTEKFSIT